MRATRLYLVIAILLFLRPVHGERPTLLSLPRDLLVSNPCDGMDMKINSALDGCGDLVSGPELLALTVEDAVVDEGHQPRGIRRHRVRYDAPQSNSGSRP